MKLRTSSPYGKRMGDSRRFHEFSRIIRRHIPLTASIADVAGGKGYLQKSLRELGFKEVTTWDKRSRYADSRVKHSYRYQWFSRDVKECYGAVVAMHPDEGTDHALLYALDHHIPAVICPCCVKPSATLYWGKHSFGNWKKHLTRLAEDRGVEPIWTAMPITGRNEVLIIKP